MNYRSIALTLALLVPLSSAQAVDLYGDLNYEIQYFEIAEESFTPQMLTGSLGVWISPGIGIEGTLGVGVADDTDNGLTLETDKMTALNLRLESPNHVGVTAYVLLGAVSYDLKGSRTGTSFPGQETFDGYQVSVGVNQYFPDHPNTALNLSATTYGVDQGIDSYGLRIGIRRDF